MREGWVEAKLGDLVEKIGMGPFGSNIKVSTFVPEGVPIISGAHLIKPILTEDKFNFLTEEHADRLKGSNVQRGDLVLTHAGTVGQVSLVPENSKYERYVVSQRGFYVRPKKSLTDASYLLLFLKYGDGQVQLLSNINRTGVPSLSQPVTFTKQIKVTLPPIAEQKRIVDVVSSVDAYIDALQQQVDATRTSRNAVLHELLTAGGDDWTETTLGDVAEVLDRMRKPISAAEREKRPGKVPYYGATGQAGWIDKPIFDDELVLLGEDAIDFLNPDVHKAYLISGPSWVNNHAHVLKPRTGKVIPFFLMESLNAVDYSQFVAFGTRSKLTQGSMMGISVNLPSIAEQQRIVDVVSSMDDVIQSAERAVVEAKNLRSGLLSDLLSGEHEIPVSYDELLGAA
jgi:restriction endonuclease S subunit